MAYFECLKCDEKYYSNLAAQIHVQSEHDIHGTNHSEFIKIKQPVHEKVI